VSCCADVVRCSVVLLSSAPAQSAAAKDVKGKAKPKGKAGVNAQEFELGEYGFDSNYNYAQHFKPMGVSGGVFMEAPVPKGAPKKGQKPVRNNISEQCPNYALYTVQRTHSSLVCVLWLARFSGVCAARGRGEGDDG
jgi:hypothetical protein